MAGSTLTVWLYDSAMGSAAGEVRLKDLQERQGLKVHDAVTIAWMPGADEPRVDHVRHLTATSASKGSMLGALAGLLVLNPVAGAAVGAGAGAIAHRLRGTGIDQGFLEEIGAQLAPGTSALLVLSSDADVDVVGPFIERGRARGDVRLLRADLADDAPETLRALLDDAPAETAPGTTDLDAFLAGASVAESVFELRPDYRALLVAVDGLAPAASDEESDAMLRAAEEATRVALETSPVQELPHVAAWREAYRAFGAKPQRTRNSLEALLRRTDSGLPRVNRLTDLYNAVSVLHQVPLGGEDLHRYVGSPRLLRADGTEPFLTLADGAEVTEHPEPGEVVWCDDAGVTCRRWNWRQTQRTQLRDDTTAALFILDALDPLTDGQLSATADDLVDRLAGYAPGLRVSRRLITRESALGS